MADQVDRLHVLEHWDCDGGYACAAVDHIEGCYTGDGDPLAAKGQHFADLRQQLVGAVEEAKRWEDLARRLWRLMDAEPEEIAACVALAKLMTGEQ